MKSTNKVQKTLNRVPLIGILIFVGLYVYASTLYPGGSQADPHALGFDWVHNYWCNLLNEKGMNGQVNPARPFAIAAMIILCISFMVFFIRFANAFSRNTIWRRLIKVSGILSMGFAIFFFSRYHDLMTTLSSVFGVFVVIGIIREIYKSEMLIYKLTGIFCILLLALNNYIYYTENYLEILPLLQKITLAIVLIWIIGLNLEITRQGEDFR